MFEEGVEGASRIGVWAGPGARGMFVCRARSAVDVLLSWLVARKVVAVGETDQLGRGAIA